MDIVVIGDSILDTTVLTNDLGENPDDHDCPMVQAHDIKTTLGGALNLAINIVSLENKCLYIGLHDKRVREIVEETTGGIQLVSSEPFCLVEKPIYRILRYVDKKSKHLIRIDPVIEYPLLDLDLLPKKVYPEAKVIILSDYVIGGMRQNTVIQAQKRWPKAQIILDARDPREYHGVRNVTFKMNEREYGLLSRGFIQANKSTKGPEIRVIPPKVKVVDVTGAGDSFVAGYATCLAEGGSVKNAIINATKAGSFAVTQPNIYQVTKENIKNV